MLPARAAGGGRRRTARRRRWRTASCAAPIREGERDGRERRERETGEREIGEGEDSIMRSTAAKATRSDARACTSKGQERDRGSGQGESDVSGGQKGAKNKGTKKWHTRRQRPNQPARRYLPLCRPVRRQIPRRREAAFGEPLDAPRRSNRGCSAGGCGAVAGTAGAAGAAGQAEETEKARGAATSAAGAGGAGSSFGGGGFAAGDVSTKGRGRSARVRWPIPSTKQASKGVPGAT